MISYKVNYEGLEMEIEVHDKNVLSENVNKRLSAYIIENLRMTTGMTRPEFAAWLEIPLRTIQCWEHGDRTMPDYVLKLIAYKVKMEKEAGRIPINTRKNENCKEKEK